MRYRVVEEELLHALNGIIEEMSEIGLEDDKHRALGLLEDILLSAPKAEVKGAQLGYREDK